MSNRVKITRKDLRRVLKEQIGLAQAPQAGGKIVQLDPVSVMLLSSWAKRSNEDPDGDGRFIIDSENSADFNEWFQQTWLTLAELWSDPSALSRLRAAGSLRENVGAFISRLPMAARAAFSLLALGASAIGVYKLISVIERLSSSNSERELVRNRMAMISDLIDRGCEVEADLSMSTSGGDTGSSTGTGSIDHESTVAVQSGGILIVRNCQQPGQRQVHHQQSLSAPGEPGYMGRYPPVSQHSDVQLSERTSTLLGIISESGERVDEGLWDLIRGKTQPRERVTFGDGMSHADTRGYQSTSLEDAEFALAVALVGWIESNTGWSGPSAEGALADFDREGWLGIADSDGAGPWAAVIASVGPSISSQAGEVLSEWKRSNYIVTSEPDILSGGQRPKQGIWLRWYGFKELRRARDQSRQSASMKYSF